MSAEKLARIAKVRVTTVRRTVKEVMETRERDQEIGGSRGERSEVENVLGTIAAESHEGRFAPQSMVD